MKKNRCTETEVRDENLTTAAAPAQRSGDRTRNQRGEGIISTAIAVLIVALLGVAMWTGFSSMMSDATEKTSNQIEQIGG